MWMENNVNEFLFPIFLISKILKFTFITCAQISNISCSEISFSKSLFSTCNRTGIVGRKPFSC